VGGRATAVRRPRPCRAQPDRPLSQLIRIPLRCCHDPNLVRSAPPTNPGPVHFGSLNHICAICSRRRSAAPGSQRGT